MEFSDLQKVRAEKIKSLREKGIEPFPTRSEVTHQIREATQEFTKF